jgi:hypothetical protein
MFTKSACQVLRRWDDMGSFYTCLFGVVYVTRGDFYDGSDKKQRVCKKFCANLGKSATETLEMVQQGFWD